MKLVEGKYNFIIYLCGSYGLVHEKSFFSISYNQKLL